MTAPRSECPKNLPPAFHAPDGWEWHMAERKNNRPLRYGSLTSSMDNTKATIIALPGLNDFSEKYFETAQWTNERGYNFYSLDWYGQGGSGRYLDNPHKRHCSGFDEDLADVQTWLSDHVFPKQNGPYILLGHSMGGHLGLRLLHNMPDTFIGAALIAPMFGIKALRHIPLTLVNTLNRFFRAAYVPGGSDWHPLQHPPPALSLLTKDPLRNPIHNQWLETNPHLQIGGVTYGWLHDAAQSCRTLQKLDCSKIKTHCLIFEAEHEYLVDNRHIRSVAEALPNADLVHLEDSFHEPLMERDDIRQALLKKFEHFINKRLKEREEEGTVIR